MLIQRCIFVLLDAVNLYS